jgi:hypothetical protein
MRGQSRTVAEILAHSANKQHGLVTRVQLLRAGLADGQIERRLHAGALLSVHRGVYRVGHRAPSLEATYLAAVLACGDRALLSGRAAAHLLYLLNGPAPVPEVTTATERRIEGIKTHRSRSVDDRDAALWRGIPVTSVARTLVDLAAVLPPDALARAFHEAGIRHKAKPERVEAVLARRPNTPGATQLRNVLRGDTQLTLSTLERRFLNRLREAGLPLPQTNRLASGRLVDCRWPAQHLTVELDGYRYHHSRHAWELDRRREREAHARGDDLRRYTYGDVFETPGPMLEELHRLLAT